MRVVSFDSSQFFESRQLLCRRNPARGSNTRADFKAPPASRIFSNPVCKVLRSTTSLEQFVDLETRFNNLGRQFLELEVVLLVQ